MSNEFSSIQVDKCIYTKQVYSGCIIISLYVDDRLIFGTSLDLVHLTKQFLAFNFDKNDIGEAKVILGVKIIRNNNEMILSQGHYVEKIFKKFGNYDVTFVKTPYDAYT